MSLMQSNKEQTLKSKKDQSAFLLAMIRYFKDLERQIRVKTKQFDKKPFIDYTFATADALASAYNFIKYILSVLFAGDSDSMYKLLITPAGVLVASIETLFLVAFYVLAITFAEERVKDGEDKNPYKQYLIDAQPYFRDGIKALRNFKKGWDILSTAIIALLDHAQQQGQPISLLKTYLTFYMVVIDLVGGLLAVAARFYLRSVRDLRKSMMTNNIALRSEIRELKCVPTQGEKTYLAKEMEVMSDETNDQALLAAVVLGVIDSLYLYFGILALAVLPPPALFIALIECSIYTALNTATRYDEEKNIFQKALLRTHSRCKLEFRAKQAEILRAQHFLLRKEIGDAIGLPCLPENVAKTMKDQLDELKELMLSLDAERSKLIALSTRNYSDSILLGLRNGFSIYSAFTSALFAVALVSPLSPGLLLYAIPMGFFFLGGSIAYTLIVDQYFKREQTKDYYLRCGIDAMENEESFRTFLNEGMLITMSPDDSPQKIWEVIRSLCSGWGKGSKFILDFILSRLKELGEDGHYHNTPLMNCMAVVGAFVFGIAMMLRALARVARLSLEQQDPLSKVPLRDGQRESSSLSSRRSSLLGTFSYSAGSSTVFFVPNTTINSEKATNQDASVRAEGTDRQHDIIELEEPAALNCA